jgi:hypothetical protein
LLAALRRPATRRSSGMGCFGSKDAVARVPRTQSSGEVRHGRWQRASAAGLTRCVQPQACPWQPDERNGRGKKCGG